jgi:hypothetical protein
MPKTSLGNKKKLMKELWQWLRKFQHLKQRALWRQIPIPGTFTVNSI